MRNIIIIILSISFITHTFGNDRIRTTLNELDETVKHREKYRVEKQRRIDNLKFTLSNTEEIDQRYIIYHNIFQEYKTYQYDSAYIYAMKSLSNAEIDGNSNDIAQSKCDLIFCYSTVGFFKEAEDIVRDFSTKDVSDRVLANFYERCFRYYNNLLNYIGDTPYLRGKYKNEMNQSANNALKLLNPEGFRYKMIVAQRELHLNKRYDNASIIIENLLKTPNISLNDHAILYSWLGLCYQMQEDSDQAIYYTALSVIADIRSATYETTSAMVLARYMFERGEIIRAYNYINLALDDANIYNSHIRRLEIQAIMPNISAERYDIIHKNKRRLTALLISLTIFAFVILIMLINIRRVNIELKDARHEIESKTIVLSEFNKELNSINKELADTNRIKDRYIIESLYGDSEFVDNVEKMCKVLIRKIKNRQFSDILDVVGGIGIKRERHRMATTFDSAFIKLFPNFIEEYNKLFSPNDWVTLGEDGELSTELRIIALMRLGVSEAGQIARYLNISQNTVYVYKAKVKARTIIPKEEFEKRIMLII